MTLTLPTQNHLQILLLLVFEAMVYRRQEHYRRQHQHAPLPAQAVCADGTRQQLDKDLLSCLKYFINFFFYKFGLEVRRGLSWEHGPSSGCVAGWGRLRLSRALQGAASPATVPRSPGRGRAGRCLRLVSPPWSPPPEPQCPRVC